MAIGRPLNLTPNVATKNISVVATADQTSFTVAGGYIINEIGVYRNGTRLVDGRDFTATDGAIVTLLSAATVGDVLEFAVFDAFNIADAVNTSGDSTINGSLTATSFYGDGSNLNGVSGLATGLTGSPDITINNLVGVAATYSGNVSIGGTLTYEDVTSIDSVGIITARGTIDAQSDVSIADKIIHTGDTNTAIRFPDADTFTVETGGSERIRVDSSGKLGVGTTSPLKALQVGNFTGNGEIVLASSTSGNCTLFMGDGTSDYYRGYVQYENSSDSMIFATSSAEHMRITSGGQLLINTTNNGGNPEPALMVSGRANAETDSGIMHIKRGEAAASMSAGDSVGEITFSALDGGQCAQIFAKAGIGWTGTPDSPGELIFKTTSDGSGTPTEKVRIQSGGGLSFNGDTATTNALDDYEEGTWTPSIGGNATYTNGGQVGTYVKVGRMVLAQWALTIDVQGSGSTISAISGLPFTSGVAGQVTSNLLWGPFGVSMAYAVYYVGNASTTMNLSYLASAATTFTNNPNGLTNSSTMNGTILYYTT